MKLSLIPILCLGLLFTCNKKENNPDQLAITQKYYQALNTNDIKAVQDLFHDSIRVGEGGFWSSFTKEDYGNWLKWDAVFQPKYEILKSTEQRDMISVNISKECKRILFLNEMPCITKEVLRFKDNKIYSVEVANYIQYDDEKWNANKEDLVKCIEKHAPELNGFIHDQTESGGLNYLKALEVYKLQCNRLE